MTNPEIPEEAVSAAAYALHAQDCGGEDCAHISRAEYLRDAEAILAAALPHLRVQETASKCLDCEHTHTADGCIGEPSPSDGWAGVTPSICDCPALRVQETRGLREALEAQLGILPVMVHENGYPVQALPKAELLSLLALHPATHPRPVVDRAAIARALHEHELGDPWDDAGCNDTADGTFPSCKEIYLGRADAVLALLPTEAPKHRHRFPDKCCCLTEFCPACPEHRPAGESL